MNAKYTYIYIYTYTCICVCILTLFNHESHISKLYFLEFFIFQDILRSVAWIKNVPYLVSAGNLELNKFLKDSLMQEYSELLIC